MGMAVDPELDAVARASDRPTYNSAAVEQQTGVRTATFRAWERRYGFPKPRRLPGNQRLYSDRDIAAIRWLKRRTGEGLSISHAVRLLQDRLREDARAPRAAATAGRPPSAIADDLTRALIGFDASAAEMVLGEAFAMYRMEEVCLRVVEPALIELGERRRRGEVSVVAERFATTYLRRKLFALLNAYETGHGRGHVFTACAPDEWDEVGVLILSLLLVRRGFRVDYLGPSLAADGLAEALTAQRPDLVIVSATSEETAARVPEIAAAIASLPEPRPLLAYGGRGFDETARRAAMAGTYLGSEAEAGVRAVEALIGAGKDGR
jgi:DNA-binding transcriptional MerR regulator/methylmalonyl-CoA mutase cobalamin-binding subunit